MKTVSHFVIVLAVLIGFAVGASPEKNENPKPSYYKTLQSLLRPHRLRVRPKCRERDINLIDPEKGAGGVLFGESIDRVIEMWGKPSGIMIDGIRPVWDLRIGACRFGFIDNKLATIGIHSATLENGYMTNGINFESSYEEVKKAFGEPIKETYSHLKFETENGYVLRFYFVPSSLVKEERKLISIEICHPDSGE